jgi:hypothetical protein
MVLRIFETFPGWKIRNIVETGYFGENSIQTFKSYINIVMSIENVEKKFFN